MPYKRFQENGTCPACGPVSTVVTNSRRSKIYGQTTVMRRRKCLSCGETFSTYEISKKAAVAFETRMAVKRAKQILDAAIEAAR